MITRRLLKRLKLRPVMNLARKKTFKAALTVGGLHLYNQYFFRGNQQRCFFSFFGGADTPKKTESPYQKGNYFGNATCPDHPILGDNVVFVTGSGNKQLSEDIAGYLGHKLANITSGRFKDGETYIKVNEEVRGKDVILIASLSKPSNDTTMECLLLTSTLKRNGAKSVTLIQPYTSYARQDKQIWPFRSVAISDIARYLEVSGVDRVYTLDIHNPASLGGFGGTVHAENLSAVKLAAEYYSKNFSKNSVVLTPDAGGQKRSMKFFKYYREFNNNDESEFAIMLKYRTKPNEVAAVNLLGNIEGKDCIIVDDMIDTGGTLMRAAQELKDKGAKKVYAFATHGLFNGNFYEKLKNSSLEKVFVTDSLVCRDVKGEADSGKVVRVPIAKFIADNIYELFHE